MEKKIKTKNCANCGEEFTPRFNTLEKFCSFTCANKDAKEKGKKKKRPRIPHRTAKREAQERQYAKDRKEYLSRPENKYCFIEGCNKRATTIEHRAGRRGSMLLNQEFWAPCCLDHNLELERNPELSKKYQLSKLHNGKK